MYFWIKNVTYGIAVLYISINIYAQPIFACCMEHWNFPWYAWARKMKLRKSYLGLKFGGMVQFTMKRITVWNDHTQLLFAFSDLGQLRVLSFSESLVFSLSLRLKYKYHIVLLWKHTPVCTLVRTLCCINELLSFSMLSCLCTTDDIDQWSLDINSLYAGMWVQNRGRYSPYIFICKLYTSLLKAKLSEHVSPGSIKNLLNVDTRFNNPQCQGDCCFVSGV